MDSETLVECFELMSDDDVCGLMGYLMLLVVFENNPLLMREYWRQLAASRQAEFATLLADYLTTSARVTTPRNAGVRVEPQGAPRKPGAPARALSVCPMRLW